MLQGRTTGRLAPVEWIRAQRRRPQLTAPRRGSPDSLRRVAWRSTTAAQFARIASELSDSGLETRFVRGMAQTGITVRQQVQIDVRHVDGLIGELLVVQLDGFEFHGSAADRRRDIEADARLTLRGYTVLRFDYFQVFFNWEYVLETILMAMAQGLHRDRIR